MNGLARGTQRLKIRGVTLAYHVHGEGPMLVAVPGGPGFSHAYLRSAALESRATVVYVDPIGTGDSSRLDSPAEYGRARDVSDLEALREHLGLSRLAILGHSAGGFVAQQYAIAYPSHVDRLVLFDTSPTNQADFDASLKAEMQARAGRSWFADGAAAFEVMFSRPLEETEMKELSRKILPFYLYDYEATPQLADLLSATMHVNPVRLQQAPRVAFDFRADLAKLDVPALVVVGARDFICAPRLAKLLSDSLPGSKLVTLERSGHMGHLEEPERFATLVGDFLAS
jgi:proline iminopeptidase